MQSLKARLGAAAMVALGGVHAEGEQLLFKSGLTGPEFQQAKVNLKMTALAVSDEEWAKLTTANFTQFKAIIIGDQQCRGDNVLDFWKSSSEQWAPAITGNIVAFSTAHTSSQQDVWTKIIDQAITFAAAGQGTGLYFTTSCLPEGEHAIDALAPFGEFSANDKTPTNQRNPTHQVAQFPNVEKISDEELGDWGINLAGSFTKFPSTGPNAFDPVFVSKNTDAFGQKSFADGTTGFPFVIARRAVPVGCGNGKFEPEFEECDALPVAKRFGKREDSPPSCTFNCHCAEGAVCERKKPEKPESSSSSSASSTSSSSSTSTLTIADGESTSTSSTVGPQSSHKPGGGRPDGRPVGDGSSDGHGKPGGDGRPDGRPGGDGRPHGDGKPYGNGNGRPDGHGRPGGNGRPGNHDNEGHKGNGHGGLIHRPQGPNVIGIEIILIVDYVYVCPPGSTITTTETKYLSTLTRPVYHTKVPDYPCYPCVFGDQYPEEYTTIFWESCPATPEASPIFTVQHCHSCDYATYTTSYPEYTPGAPCNSCLVADEEIELPVVAAPQVTQTKAPVVQFTGAAAPRDLGLGMGIIGGVAMAMAAM